MSVFNQFIPRPNQYASSETDINILMMGETGVGKTTFINAFANYLIHNTLHEAIKGEMQVLIPAAFVFTDSNTFEEKIIYIGNSSDDEKCAEIGQSSTQVCQSYVFPIGNRLLRLIDAPGIGDVRGITQDGKNCDHILSYISRYEHLNGICILFQPNIERITAGFRYCIKELLTHLHINAKDNLMFIFTNGKSTTFKLGTTVPILRRFLNELYEKRGVVVPVNKDNTFIFDNEAFRFLAIYKNGIRFSSDEISNYIKSWEISVKEFSRLIERIVKCDRHAVRDSLSINAAQQLIRNLTRPIGEIARLIQENILLAEKYKQSVLKDPLSTVPKRIPQKKGNVVVFDYPRTVCTSRKCTQIIVVKAQYKVDYTSKCHPHCYLRDVERECVGHPILQNCHAINKITGLCDKCGCYWDKHMHVTYEYETYVTYINLNNSNSLMSLAAIDTHITDLRQEEASILQVCSKLSQFLKENSISPYNDDILEYIRYFIREEEDKRHAGANNEAVIQGLQNMVEEYELKQKLFNLTLNNETIDVAPNFRNQGSKPEDIFDLVAQLYNLPINGANIQQQIEGLKKSQLQTNENKEHFVAVPLNANSSTVMQQLKDILGEK